MKTPIEREALSMGFDLKAAQTLKESESARITAADTEERRREEYHAMHHETHPLDFSASDPKV